MSLILMPNPTANGITTRKCNRMEREGGEEMAECVWRSHALKEIVMPSLLSAQWMSCLDKRSKASPNI